MRRCQSPTLTASPATTLPTWARVQYQIGVTNDAINLTQFQLFSGEVATFTDTDGQPAPATDFTATIYWGDGTTPTTGTIAQPGGAGNAYSVAASHTYLTSGAHTLTVTITTKSALTPETAQDATSINVQSAAATHFSVSALSTATAGASFTFTVTALDAFDDTATGYTGTVRFTSTDGQAVLPADTTLTNGVSTFIVTLATAGIQTITATDTTTSAITGTSGGVLVSAAAATHFAVSVPSSARGCTLQCHGDGTRCVRQHGNRLHGHGAFQQQLRLGDFASGLPSDRRNRLVQRHLCGGRNGNDLRRGHNKRLDYRGH